MSMHINNAALPRCICLAGPTASGKTAAALGIAAHLKGKIPVEIISVDSALVYKGLDIGTAKPSAAELAAVPHHLIDIRDPLQPYSAAEFAHDATRLMSEITARGHLPLLVGGTMLYFKALFEGLDDMPKADVAIRAELEREAAQLGWPAMHQKLAVIDPITAARLQPNDAQRIQRALEVYRISGKPLSTFQNKNNAKNAINNIANYLINTLATDKLFNKNVLFISLEPQNRAWLHERIALRFDAMLASGFEAEVRSLRARGDLHVDTPSVRCVGYRQMWEALDTLEDASKDGILDKKSASKIMDELREKGIAATRQLCKRQLTWLRGMPQRQVVACDEQDALEQVLTLVDAWLPSIAP